MLNGLLWILSTGAQWRDLPERFGPWETVYHRFNAWRKAGIYDAILDGSVLEARSFVFGQGLSGSRVSTLGDGSGGRSGRTLTFRPRIRVPCITSTT